MVSLLSAFLACSTVNFLAPTATGPAGATAPAGSGSPASPAPDLTPSRGMPTSPNADNPDAPVLHAKPRLIAEGNRLVAGKTNTLAIVFDIEPHWHMYWPGLNDTGIPASAEFELPEGFTEGAWQWPGPHKRQVLPGDIVDHIYEDRFAVLVPIDVPADAKEGPRTIKARLHWLVCADGCVLEEKEVSLDVSVVPSTTPDASDLINLSDDDKLIRATKDRIPASLNDQRIGISADGSLGYQVRTEGDSITLGIKTERANFIAFYPEEGCLPLSDRINGTVAEGQSLDIQFDAPSRVVSNADDIAPGIRGVIEARLAPSYAPQFYRIARSFSNEASTTDPVPSSTQKH